MKKTWAQYLEEKEEREYRQRQEDRKTYCLKENGRINFSPQEMLIIRNELRKFDNTLTIDQIFFTSKMDKASNSN